MTAPATAFDDHVKEVTAAFQTAQPDSHGLRPDLIELSHARLIGQDIDLFWQLGRETQCHILGFRYNQIVFEQMLTRHFPAGVTEKDHTSVRIHLMTQMVVRASCPILAAEDRRREACRVLLPRALKAKRSGFAF